MMFYKIIVTNGAVLRTGAYMLMLPLAETNEGEGAHHVLRQSIKKVI